MITDIDLLFIAYLTQSGKTKMDISKHLNVSYRTIISMWRQGVGQWRLDDVIKTAYFLGIPIDTLRETITYRKDKS